LEGAVKKKVARFLSKVLNAAFCINLHCNPLRKPLDGVFYGAAIEKRPFATAAMKSVSMWRQEIRFAMRQL